MLPFLSLVSVAEVARNPTVKDEFASVGGAAMSALMFTYPVHQAADILFCRANLVPGSPDDVASEAERLDDGHQPGARHRGGDAWRCSRLDAQRVLIEQLHPPPERRSSSGPSLEQPIPVAPGASLLGRAKEQERA